MLTAVCATAARPGLQIPSRLTPQAARAADGILILKRYLMVRSIREV
jgi:hypothetical protein